MVFGVCAVVLSRVIRDKISIMRKSSSVGCCLRMRLFRRSVATTWVGRVASGGGGALGGAVVSTVRGV